MSGNGRTQGGKGSDGTGRLRTSSGSAAPSQIEHTLARPRRGQLWELLPSEDYLPTLGALSGAQAVQMVKAGAKGIYVSGWQVAGDATLPAILIPTSPSNRRTACRRSCAA